MKVSKFLAALLVAGGAALLTTPIAMADSVSGGGQILQDADGTHCKGTDGIDCKISFTFPEEATTYPLAGTLKIVFHSTSEFNKATFEGTVSAFDRLPNCDQSTQNSSIPTVKVVKITAIGTLDGESGYKVILYASDSGPHGQWNNDQNGANGANGADAINILVYHPGSTKVYGTAENESADFSSDVTACPYSSSNNRTYLKHGDITITP